MSDTFRIRDDIASACLMPSAQSIGYIDVNLLDFTGLPLTVMIPRAILTDQPRTCTCAGGLSYEGPSLSCPIHGALAAFGEVRNKLDEIDLTLQQSGYEPGPAGLRMLVADLRAINAQLVAAGITYPMGAAGVRDLAAMAVGRLDELRAMERLRDAAYAWADVATGLIDPPLFRRTRRELIDAVRALRAAAIQPLPAEQTESAQPVVAEPQALTDDLSGPQWAPFVTGHLACPACGLHVPLVVEAIVSGNQIDLRPDMTDVSLHAWQHAEGDRS